MVSRRPINVLFAAAEADPIIKVGGLGDVTGSLPRALQALEPQETGGTTLDVRLAIPLHASVTARLPGLEHVATFDVPHPGDPIQASAFLTRMEDLPVYLISGPPIAPDSPVYNMDTRKDGEKFTFFSLALLELARALDWKIDLLHANDWHTALAAYALMMRRPVDPFFTTTRSILTVHNLAYMGAGTEDALYAYGIPPLRDSRLPPWGAYQPLPMGLSTADYVTTVSPGYAQEIMTPEFGCGLQDFLQMRAGTITGILNGIDLALWDPSTDTALPQVFDPGTLDRRNRNKSELLRELDLRDSPETPLLILISRMGYQKGVDLALEALRQSAGTPWQAILLGTGDPGLEANAQQLEAEFPARIRAILRYDGQLARRMYGGGDMLLMPSRYEPCGLAQMIAMRYGCIPVARATGGLRDTILDSQNAETSTGFLFEEQNAAALSEALQRATAAFSNAEGWRTRQKNAMLQDFSWKRSAHSYLEIYQRLVNRDV